MYLYIAVPWDGSDISYTTPDSWKSGDSCPKYLQRRTSPYDGNNRFYTDNIGDIYWNKPLMVDGSEYVVFYISLSTVYTGNESDLNNTLLHNASSTYNIQGSPLPFGTKVWKFYHWSTFDRPSEFGKKEGGKYDVPVAVYSAYTVPEGYNSWISMGSGVYEFYANANSIFNITNYPGMEMTYSLSKDTQYTFTMYTNSETNWDGIIISHTRLTTMSSGQISNFGAANCSGNGVIQTYTYTPTYNQTIYFYFRTDGSTLHPNPSFGSITITTKSKNTIDYSPYNNTCYTSSSSQQVHIAFKSSCASGSLTFSTSRWSISSNGTYLTIPANTAAGTYGVTITVTSPDSENYYSVTETRSITITISASATKITSISPSTTSSSRKVIYNRSGYNTFTITVSPSGATVSFTSSDTSKATVSSAGLVTYVSAGDLTITVTGTGDYEGTHTCYVSCVVDTEDSTQYKNDTCTIQGVNISSYGTPTVSIGSGLVAGRFVDDGRYYDGGSATVTASVTNNTQWYQEWASGYVQSHTGTQAGSVNLSMTANGNSRFKLSGTTITHDWMKDYIGTDTVTIKATNAGSSSEYASTSASVTNGIDRYDPIEYIFNSSNIASESEVSLVQYADLPVTALTLSTSNIENYFKLEYTLNSSYAFEGARQTAYYTSGWAELYDLNDKKGVWSGNNTSLSILTTATNRASVTINTLTLTFTGSGGYTDTFSTGSSVYRAANQVTGYTDYQNPTGLTISASVVPASGGTATITWSGTCKQNAKAVYTSGATASSYTSLTISSPTKSISGNGSVSSKGTTISNQTSAKTVTGTYSANGKSSTTTCTVYQAGNYVTAITPKSSSNTDGTHFSYANIGAGATSASPSLSGGALYTFSSGRTTFDSSSSPSFGGSSSYTRSYTLAKSQNGFTAVNSSTGVLTATSRGTTPGAARSSANVTGTLVVTYTHASSYSAGGTVTSSTKSNTQTCTQNANALESISLSVANNPINYNTTTTCSVSATYTSGSSKYVTGLLFVNASSGNRIVVGDKTIITIV